MVKIRKINEKRLDKMVREIVARGEGVRSFQNAKQAIINGFKKEYQRHKNGGISQKALFVSSKRVTRELASLDAKIRNDIGKAVTSAKSAEKYVHIYLPEKVKATSRGISKAARKKVRKKATKQAVKRKTANLTVKKRAAKKRTVRRKAPARRTKARKAAQSTSRRRKK